MVPLRASQLIDAPEGAVRRAFRSPDLWVRTGTAAGLRIEIASREPALGHRITGGDVLSVRPTGGRGRALFGGRRLLLTVSLPETSGAVPVPELRRVAGPLRRCDVELATANTAAGTLATVTCRAVANPPWLTPLLRRPVLDALQLLLGITTLIAREPVVVVAAAIVRGGRMLAARRPPDPSGHSTWELPGGKVEAGETDAQALRREIGEELDLAVTVHDRVGDDVDLGDNRSLRCFLVDAADGEPMPAEHDELRWLAADELDTVQWSHADRALLPAVREVLAGR